MSYDSIPGPPPAPSRRSWIEITTALDREPRYLQLPKRPATEQIVNIPWPEAEPALPEGPTRCAFCGNRESLDGFGQCLGCGARP